MCVSAFYNTTVSSWTLASLSASWGKCYIILCVNNTGHDENSLVLWNVQTGAAMCGSPTHSDFTLTLKFLKNDRNRLVTAGKNNIHLWEYKADINKLKSHSIEMGKNVRQFACLDISPDDEYVYAGVWGT